jgi:hypothetical protein
VYNQWLTLKESERTTDALLRRLDFDFFEVLDSVTIARSRKYVEKYYNMNEIGTFPKRLKPITLRPRLTDLESAINYCINYDIHWNPVRIIQRFGRIDRIGSQNAAIQQVNFWPDVDLDEYLSLKGRVETRMRIKS